MVTATTERNIDKSRARQCLARSPERVAKREELLDSITDRRIQWYTEEAVTHESVIRARDPVGGSIYRLERGR